MPERHAMKVSYSANLLPHARLRRDICPALPDHWPARQQIGLKKEVMERATGIEPVSLAWKARVLPLHNARSGAG